MILEEKWWKPKTFEQLEREEKERQLTKWVRDKCSDIIAYVSKNRSRFNGVYRECDGVLKVYGRTIETYKDYSFGVCYDVDINDFWDKDSPIDMRIVEDTSY